MTLNLGTLEGRLCSVCGRKPDTWSQSAHEGICPRVESVEYYESGVVKQVNVREPVEVGVRWPGQEENDE